MISDNEPIRFVSSGSVIYCVLLLFEATRISRKKSIKANICSNAHKHLNAETNKNLISNTWAKVYSARQYMALP